MDIEIVNDLDRFDQFVKSYTITNIMQTSSWAKVKDDDWKAHYLFFKEDGNIIASAMLLERVAFLKQSLFYCPRGFVYDYKDEGRVKEIITLLKGYVKQQGGFVLKFDPELCLYRKDSRTLDIIEDNMDKFKVISKYALHLGLNLSMDSSFQPRFQTLVNLQDGDLKSKVKAKKRRLVNEDYLSKRGFEIIEDTSEYGVKEFARLSRLTEIKQGVSLRNEAYFMKMFEAFKDKEEIKIYFAQVNMDKLIDFVSDEDEKNYLSEYRERHGKIIRTNGILCIYGTPIVQMFYGASDDEFSKHKAGYRLHFQGMLDAQDAGYSYFNLGGVQGSLDDGLFRFKAEFHPELFEYMGDFDLIIRPLTYKIFNLALKLRKKLKRR